MKKELLEKQEVLSENTNALTKNWNETVVFKEMNNLFKLNKQDFWRKVKSLGKRNPTLNIQEEKLRSENEKILTESNCTNKELADQQKKIDEF